MTFFKYKEAPDFSDKIIDMKGKKACALVRKLCEKDEVKVCADTPVYYYPLASGHILVSLNTFDDSGKRKANNETISHLVIVNPDAERADKKAIIEIYRHEHDKSANGNYSENRLEVDFIDAMGNITCHFHTNRAEYERVRVKDPNPAIVSQSFADGTLFQQRIEELSTQEAALRSTAAQIEAQIAALQQQLRGVHDELGKVVQSEGVFQSSSFRLS